MDKGELNTLYDALNEVIGGLIKIRSLVFYKLGAPDNGYDEVIKRLEYSPFKKVPTRTEEEMWKYARAVCAKVNKENEPYVASNCTSRQRQIIHIQAGYEGLQTRSLGYGLTRKIEVFR